MSNWLASVLRFWPRKTVALPVDPAPIVPPQEPFAPDGDEARADVELTITRARLDGFAAALLGEQGIGAGPVSPDRLTKAFNGAIDRAGGTGSATVSRSPAGVYTPEYWRFRIEAADSIAQGVLARANTSRPVA